MIYHNQTINPYRFPRFKSQKNSYHKQFRKLIQRKLYLLIIYHFNYSDDSKQNVRKFYGKKYYNLFSIMSLRNFS